MPVGGGWHAAASPRMTDSDDSDAPGGRFRLTRTIGAVPAAVRLTTSPRPAPSVDSGGSRRVPIVPATLPLPTHALAG